MCELVRLVRLLLECYKIRFSHDIAWSYSIKWAMTRDFQQCVILTCVDLNKPLQPLDKLRNSKWCSVSGLTIIEYSSNQQRLWLDCVYEQADLRLCLSHISHCWKSYVKAQMCLLHRIYVRLGSICPFVVGMLQHMVFSLHSLIIFYKIILY